MNNECHIEQLGKCTIFRYYSHPAGIEVSYMICAFTYIYSCLMRATKAMVSLRICADSLEPSVLDDAISTKTSCTDTTIVFFI